MLAMGSGVRGGLASEWPGCRPQDLVPDQQPGAGEPEGADRLSVGVPRRDRASGSATIPTPMHRRRRRSPRWCAATGPPAARCSRHRVSSAALLVAVALAAAPVAAGGGALRGRQGRPTTGSTITRPSARASGTATGTAAGTCTGAGAGGVAGAAARAGRRSRRPSRPPTPPPSPTPLPSRTSVDLTDDDDIGWQVTPAYRELRAGRGRVQRGQPRRWTTTTSRSARRPAARDARHRRARARQTRHAPAHAGAGVYTLFCSVADARVTLGMRADVTIRALATLGPAVEPLAHRDVMRGVLA